MFFNGKSIKRLVWPGPDNSAVTVGVAGVNSIEAVPVEGNGGFYSWFIVEHDDGTTFVYNSLHISDIELATPPEGE